MRVLFAWIAVAASVTGCAQPTTYKAPVGDSDVAREAEEQQIFLLKARAQHDERLRGIVMPLMVAASDLCPDHRGPLFGMLLHNSAHYADEMRAVAIKHYGLDDSPRVLFVIPGFPASDSGLKTGDVIKAVAGKAVAPGKDSPKNAFTLIAEAAVKSGAAPIEIERDGKRIAVGLKPKVGCGYGIGVKQDDTMNAFADGKNLVVHTRMLEAMNDYEIAVVVGHELAHNVMKHIEARQTNSVVASIPGILLDVAAAVFGVNTQGAFTKSFGNIGSRAFSQDFETEADYVGLYIIARAGHPVAQAGEVWRKMAVLTGGASITYASTHPTTAERFLRLKDAAAEIERKRAAGMPLEPEKRPEVVAAKQSGTASRQLEPEPTGR